MAALRFPPAAPIPFTGEMVRALKRGKIQTRRTNGLQAVNATPDQWDLLDFDPLEGIGVFVGRDGQVKVKCPFGGIGGLLWVREAVCGTHGRNATYLADQERLVDALPLGETLWDHFPPLSSRAFIPPMHMPRYACRYTRELTGLHLLRLFDISEEDARAEGVEQLSADSWRDYVAPDATCASARQSFLSLWEALSSRGPNPTPTNPWVWRVTFSLRNV